MGKGLHRSSLFLFVAALVIAVGITHPARHERPSSTSDKTLPAISSAPSALIPALNATLAVDTPDYFAMPASDQPNGLTAANPAHHLAIGFSVDGVHFRTAPSGGPRGDSWAIHLAAIGREGNLSRVDSVPPTRSGTRVEYRRGGTTEWYVNGPLGLEQGFTLNTRPDSGGDNGKLLLALSLDGHIAPALTPTGLILSGPDGRYAYGGLIVVDTNGLVVPATFATNGQRIDILVDDRDAQYPLTIDPILQEAKLTAGDATSRYQVGFSIAVSDDGTTIAAGAIGADSGVGGTYIFARGYSGWVQQAKLVFPPEADQVGRSVALSRDGNVAVVGAIGNQGATGGGNVGAAYVFTRAGTTWTRQAVLTASDGQASDLFGWHVAITDDATRIAVAAIGQNSNTGAAYVFSGSGATWTQRSEIVAAECVSGDAFGRGFALSGDGTTLVVGAPGVNAGTGAAFVFTLSDTSWSQQARIVGNDVRGGEDFGVAVSISRDGNTVVAGADNKSRNPGDPASGAAYIFTRVGPTWGQQGELFGADTTQVVHFGTAVALTSDGNTAAVGADNAGLNVGGIYVFSRGSGTWSQQAKLVSSDGVPDDRFGSAVAASSGGILFVGGAPAVNASTGAVYLFTSPTSFGVSAPATTPANSPFPVTVSALDAKGTVITGYTGTVHLTSTDPQALLPADYTFVAGDNGAHTFSFTLKTIGTQSITATDTATSSVSGTRSGIAVTSGAAASFAVAGFPDPITAGVAGTFTVTATDSGGNTATGYRGTVHFASSDAQATLPANYTFSAADNGVHTFTATLKTAGEQSITVTDIATTSVTGTQDAVTVNHAAAAAIVPSIDTVPQSAMVNTAFDSNLDAVVTDAFGNPVGGVAVTFTAPSSGATGIFANGLHKVTVTSDPTTGEAIATTFTATDKVGTYSVVASATGLAPSATFGMTNTAGAPSRMTVVAGNNQSATVATGFPAAMQVRVKDANGNAVAGVAVTFSPPATGASGTFAGGVTTATTDGTGTATAPAFTANTTAGKYKVAATAAGIAAPVKFAMTNKADNPTTVVAFAGSGKSAKVNATFGTRMKAKVTDQYGNAISGVTVTFTAPGSGPSGTFAGGATSATAVTNASGVATAPAFTANGTRGSYSVVATGPGATTSATFALTNT